jgi:hypothetical protein
MSNQLQCFPKRRRTAVPANTLAAAACTIEATAADTGRQTSKEASVRYIRIILAAASLAACEQAVNAGDQVEVRVVDSTGIPNLVITVSTSSGSSFTQTCEGACPVINAPTDIETAGGAVLFHVEAGEETADHTCHVHADAIGNEDNVPTAVIYSGPLRVVCQSGWQEEGAE